MVDLLKMQKVIEEGFKAGKKDDRIAQELGISFEQCRNLRVLLGFRYSWALDVFANESKVVDKLGKRFRIPNFSIPENIADELRLKDGTNYVFTAKAVKPKTIEITIAERE